MTAADRGMLRNFEQAKHAGAYDLATRWLRPPDGSSPETLTVDAQLNELAVMSGLAFWMKTWLPIHMHRALMVGASVEEVAEACGLEFAEVTKAWREWSDGQRHLLEQVVGMPDITAEVDQVDDLIRRAAYDRTLPNPAGNLRMAPRVRATSDTDHPEDPLR